MDMLERMRRTIDPFKRFAVLAPQRPIATRLSLIRLAAGVCEIVNGMDDRYAGQKSPPPARGIGCEVLDRGEDKLVLIELCFDHRELWVMGSNPTRAPPPLI